MLATNLSSMTIWSLLHETVTISMHITGHKGRNGWPKGFIMRRAFLGKILYNWSFSGLQHLYSDEYNYLPSRRCHIYEIYFVPCCSSYISPCGVASSCKGRRPVSIFSTLWGHDRLLHHLTNCLWTTTDQQIVIALDVIPVLYTDEVCDVLKQFRKWPTPELNITHFFL